MFYSHVDLDNDRCRVFDRVRTEIKTHAPSPDFLKGFYGETVSYSWDFRLDASFQPATSFTHIFQVKAVGGEDSQPFITITPRLTSVGTTVILPSLFARVKISLNIPTNSVIAIDSLRLQFRPIDNLARSASKFSGYMDTR